MAETTFKFPKLDLEALFAFQKANLASAQEAQAVLLDAVQAILKSQHGYAQELASETESLLSTKEPKKPEVVLAAMKAAAQKAMSVTKEGVDLGLAAQRRVADLTTKRVQANLDELKTLAA
ncbi:MAG: hypothetical protein U1E17_11255 [Geminicoccaceae bacterium]